MDKCKNCEYIQRITDMHNEFINGKEKLIEENKQLKKSLQKTVSILTELLQERWQYDE